MRNIRIKRVMTWSPSEGKARLFRLMWERGSFGSGGYSAKLAVSLVRKLIGYRNDSNGWRVTLAGIQVHLCRSYGGRFA